jgi:hypothetical protein
MQIMTKTNRIPIKISTEPAMSICTLPKCAKLIGIELEIATPDPYNINKIPTPTKINYITTKEE